MRIAAMQVKEGSSVRTVIISGSLTLLLLLTSPLVLATSLAVIESVCVEGKERKGKESLMRINPYVEGQSPTEGGRITERVREIFVLSSFG